MTGSGALSGRSVVVVGGSSGIGLAVARAALAVGAEVTVGGRDPQRACSEVDGARPLTLDVTDDAAVSTAFSGLDRIDHLVCTAASGFPSGLFRAAAQEVRDLMESKFWGQYRCARAAAPLIPKGGSITFTSGIRSRRPARGTEAFTAVNNAVEGMGRALAVELAPLRVNVVAPGTVETPVFDFMAPDIRAARLQKAGEQTTVGRVGQPDEVAEVYLLCMTNGFLSGAVIDADGGAVLV